MAAIYLTGERSTRMARRTIQHIRANTTDMAESVMTFDPHDHVDAAIAAAEQERIFSRQPMLAAHSSELAEAGAFVTVELNRSSIILTRKSDGGVGAFINACRHRGARLVDDERGRRKLFTCPYHAWTYANDGALKAVTFANSFGELPCKLSLVELPVEERHGFVWVIEDPSARIDVRKFLGDTMDDLLAELNLGRFHFYKGEGLELPQNWKVMMDGVLDSYHVRFLHQKTIAPFVHHNITTIDVATDHLFWGTPRRRIDQVLDQPPETIDLTRYMLFGLFLAPNTQLTLHPHHIEFWTIYQHPDGPQKSRAHLRFLTPEKIESDEQRAVLDKNYTILLDAVFNEDVPVGNGIQATSAMPGIGMAMLGKNEVLNQAFHRAHQRLMDGTAIGGAPDDAERMRDEYDALAEMTHGHRRAAAG